MKNKYYCRVCGYENNEPPWGEAENDPSYVICSCCGVEAGHEDVTIESIKSYRDEWLKNGAKWFISKKQPINWDLNKQLQQIPLRFR